MKINSISYKSNTNNSFNSSSFVYLLNFKAKENSTDTFDATNKNFKEKNINKVKKGFDYVQKAFSKLYYKFLPKKNTKISIQKTEELKPTTFPKSSKIVEFPKPNFSFDIQRLKETLKHNTKISAGWIEDNQADFNNIIKAISTIDSMEQAKIKSLDEFNDLFDSKQGQANVINLIISSPDFFKNAQDQYAKEKKAYVDSIMPYLYKRDKQLKIQAIEVIEKYGSWEHGDKLGLFLGKRDEEIVVPVVRAIAATGKKDDALLITSFIEDVKDVYTPETFKEILSCAAKLGDVRGWKKNDADILLAPIRRLTKSDNHEVAQAAKDALNKILNK